MVRRQAVGALANVAQSLSRSVSTSAARLEPALEHNVARTMMTAAEPAVEPHHSVSPPPEPVPNIVVSEYGTVSVAHSETSAAKSAIYENVDGKRVEDGRYRKFEDKISKFIPEARRISDGVRTFAYGTDASFYRLNPRLVVKVHSEEEVAAILPIAKECDVPVTFRAAGTSLSGQAITDSVLLKLSHTGKNFRNYTVHEDGNQITVEPGIIGGEINRILKAHKAKHSHAIAYKLGPDPSSVDSCMVGGIVNNNSSGMCCGVSQNSYHTVRDLRLVFADGTILDTADPESRTQFLENRRDLVAGIIKIAQRVQQDRELTSLIRRKFAIKCTTGYSLNALVDFPVSDPIEMIKRLIIGSEGTMAFVSRATYNTVPDAPEKASTFMIFPHLNDACKAAYILREKTPVDAVELFDRACLRESQKHEKLPNLVPEISGKLDPHAAALLIECRGQTPEELQLRISEVQAALKSGNLQFGGSTTTLKNLEDYAFDHDPEVYETYWDVRRGLIPMVGASRETGTSMLIEDVACPVENLADMTMDLNAMFARYGYDDACCLGHALEGNLHLIFSQGFRTKDEVQRFSDMMTEMCYIVATKYSGSLKGEHGTGRNMAPFVEMEWGKKAYDLMWELKELFDPDMVLNPGVLLNRDHAAHIKHLKPSPPASEIVDRCIECGFCESNCPSRDLSLTPRQRITIYREINRLRAMDNKTKAEDARLQEFEKLFQYLGEQTCAADGMCQVKCPVRINTGELIKSLRTEELNKAKTAGGIAMRLANNFSRIQSLVPPLLNTVNFVHSITGPMPLEKISGFLNKVSGNYVPAWNPYMPKGAAKLKDPAAVTPVAGPGIPRKVVYLPACVTRMMGPSLSDTESASVHEKLLSIFEKAKFEVVYPEGIANSCCGMMFSTRGFKAAADSKLAETEKALLEASENGKYPIVCDTSPCLATIKEGLASKELQFSLYEPVEFIRLFLTDKLEFRKVRDSIAIHVPCSSKKLGLEKAFTELAHKCAHEVVPSGIPCCGMAGDRGMRYPELTGSSLQHLNIPQEVKDGYSTSRTCEISLSNHSGINFRGMVYLVDEATTAKAE